MSQVLRGIFRKTRNALRVCTGKELRVPVELKCEHISLGNTSGVWCVRPDLIGRESVIYSFGVGDDISFEAAVIERFGATVHAFDPTPRSLHWLRNQPQSERLIFHELGISDYDGIAKFYPPLRRDHVSYSTCVREETAVDAVRCSVRRLETIMAELGHRRLDLLKLDIEGSEYAVLPDVLSSIAPRQLLVEFHHRWQNIGVVKTREAIEMLRRRGYRIFYISDTVMEYSFSFE